ncbi:hypothetical protein Purlil1_1584 [Purpureocillium lilacinum]|uniref:Uncharacterized protein n=1 Tax=Purpureocillium lilacinum TaxID=33203 RepID=A0ABR0CCE9_PURLI|nr:hypothetical protein Purlil1_1584 [Purpureocillium lilacinum]
MHLLLINAFQDPTCHAASCAAIAKHLQQRSSLLHICTLHPPVSIGSTEPTPPRQPSWLPDIVRPWAQPTCGGAAFPPGSRALKPTKLVMLGAEKRSNINVERGPSSTRATFFSACIHPRGDEKRDR